MEYIVTCPLSSVAQAPRRKDSLSVGVVIGGSPEPGTSAPCVGEVSDEGCGPAGKPPRNLPVDATYPDLWKVKTAVQSAATKANSLVSRCIAMPRVNPSTDWFAGFYINQVDLNLHRNTRLSFGYVLSDWKRDLRIPFHLKQKSSTYLVRLEYDKDLGSLPVREDRQMSCCCYYY